MQIISELFPSGQHWIELKLFPRIRQQSTALLHNAGGLGEADVRGTLQVVIRQQRGLASAPWYGGAGRPVSPARQPGCMASPRLNRALRLLGRSTLAHAGAMPASLAACQLRKVLVPSANQRPAGNGRVNWRVGKLRRHVFIAVNCKVSQLSAYANKIFASNLPYSFSWSHFML